MKSSFDPQAKQRLASSLAEMTARLRHGLGITATGLVLGVVVAYAALASFGAVEVLLSLWQPAHAPGQIGWHGFNPILLLVPTVSGLLIGGLLVWLTPRRPVELADVIHAAHEPDPVVSRTGG